MENTNPKSAGGHNDPLAKRLGISEIPSPARDNKRRPNDRPMRANSGSGNGRNNSSVSRPPYRGNAGGNTGGNSGRPRINRNDIDLRPRLSGGISEESIVEKESITPMEVRPPKPPRVQKSKMGGHTIHGTTINIRPAEDNNDFKSDRFTPKAPAIKPAPRTKKTAGEKTEDTVRFVALGGLEEVGRNMSFFEYEDEIVIIDAGIQFPEEETPGVDFIIPNVEYLESKKENIKALIITHAHFDHIGAIPYLIGKIGNPPIYTTRLAREMIVKRQAEFVNAPKLDVRVIKDRDLVRLSKNIEGEFFGVPHSVPDTTGVILKTPVGNFVTFADFRLDYDVAGNIVGSEDLEWVRSRNIHTVFLDSTNAETPGYSLSERIVEKNLEELFKKADGRIIVGIFSTHITRIGEIIKIAERIGRKIVFSGRSIKENMEVTRGLGYVKVGPDTVIQPEEIDKYADEKILIISTGAQGESNASLMRIVSGENRNIRIKPGDSVVFSSSIIPGNERSVQILKDNLVRQGAIVYQSKLLDIHASGHASQEEIKLILKTIKPRFFVPVHGYMFMRSMNAHNGMEAGIPKNNIVLADNGEVVELCKDSVRITGEEVPATYVMVDGLGIGDVGEVVLRDRRLLSQEGIVVVIATIDRRKGQLIRNPDIITRGFIYIKENQRIVDEIRAKVKGIFARLPQNQELESDYVKGLIRDQIGQFLYNRTYRRPMVIPVLIEL